MLRSDKREQASENNPFGGSSVYDDPDAKQAEITTSEAFRAKFAKKDKVTKNELATTIQNKEIRTGGFVWTSVGLEVDGDISLADWQLTGELLHTVDTSIQWLIGDWLIAGEELEYGSRETFAKELGFDVTTLYDYASVARKVEISLRNEILSFNHHRAVAKLLKTEDQKYWLDKAVAGDGDGNRWSVKRLREEIKNADGKKLPSPLTTFDKVTKKFQAFQKSMPMDKLSADERATLARDLIAYAEQLKNGTV